MKFKGSIAVFSVFAFLSPKCEAQIKFLVVTEDAQPEMNQRFADGLQAAQTETGEAFDMFDIKFARKTADAAHEEMCTELKSGDFSAVVDLSWGGWIRGRKTANSLGLPYIRLQAANHQFVQAADDFMQAQKSVDAALIFEDKSKLDQSLYYIIGNSFLRIIGARMDDPEDSFKRLKKMRPRPSNYIVWGSTDKVKEAYEKARTMDMLKRDIRWTLVFEDMKSGDFKNSLLDDQTNFVEMTDGDNCCIIMNKKGR